MDVMLSVLVTPYFYLPVWGACSIGWLETLGVPKLIQALISTNTAGNIVVSVLILFEYRHHQVLPLNSPVRLSNPMRIGLIFVNYCFVCGGLIQIVLTEPEDQVAAKVKTVEFAIPFVLMGAPFVIAGLQAYFGIFFQTMNPVIFNVKCNDVIQKHSVDGSLSDWFIAPLGAELGRRLDIQNLNRLHPNIWMIIKDILVPLFITPFLYLPVLGGCSIGWFTTIGVPVNIQTVIGFLSIISVQISILVLFEYRHHHVLPVDNAFRFKKSTRIFYILGNLLFYCVGFSSAVALAPKDQYSAKLKAIEILNCTPPRIFTPCAIILDVTSKTGCPRGYPHEVHRPTREVQRGNVDDPSLRSSSSQLWKMQCDSLGGPDWEDGNDTKSINIDGKNLTNLGFADNIVLFANNTSDISSMLNEQDAVKKKIGIQMSPITFVKDHKVVFVTLFLFQNKFLKYYEVLVYIGIVIESHYLLFVNFLYRYFMISRKVAETKNAFSKKDIGLLALLNVAVTLNFFFFAKKFEAKESVDLQLLEDIKTTFHVEIAPYGFLYADLSNNREYFPMAGMLSGWFILILAMTFIGLKTYKMLNQHVLNLPVQKQIFNAILCQSFAPFLLSLLPCAIIVISTLSDLDLGTFPNFLMVSQSFQPVIDPLFTLLLIKIYRKKVIGFLTFLCRPEQTTSFSSIGIGSAQVTPEQIEVTSL
ncbi:unnamed protein product [Caenorhabditis auriculariae]|uniref:Uncharacterized protein n=1 Tax=Caenorhabditis auriculariae TaxID=2777116 RepID=A0A8S1HD79_9PELO|nr:unnamed protein product [Caenorhabditis auriculariae]